MAKGLPYANTRYAGVSTGLNFGPFVGIRGFYWRGLEDGYFNSSFSKLALYGGEGKFKLNSGQGLTPSILLGGGVIDAMKGYQADSATTGPLDKKGFVSGGLGLDLPFGRAVKLTAYAKALLTAPDSIINAVDPNKLATSWAYGLSLNLLIGNGIKDSESKKEESYDELVMNNLKREKNRADNLKDDYEKRIDRLDDLIKDARRDDDRQRQYDLQDEQERLEQGVKEIENLTEKEEKANREANKKDDAFLIDMKPTEYRDQLDDIEKQYGRGTSSGSRSFFNDRNDRSGNDRNNSDNDRDVRALEDRLKSIEQKLDDMQRNNQRGRQNQMNYDNRSNGNYGNDYNGNNGYDRNGDSRDSRSDYNRNDDRRNDDYRNNNDRNQRYDDRDNRNDDRNNQYDERDYRSNDRNNNNDDSRSRQNYDDRNDRNQDNRNDNRRNNDRYDQNDNYRNNNGNYDDRNQNMRDNAGSSRNGAYPSDTNDKMMALKEQRQKGENLRKAYEDRIDQLDDQIKEAKDKGDDKMESELKDEKESLEDGVKDIRNAMDKEDRANRRANRDNDASQLRMESDEFRSMMDDVNKKNEKYQKDIDRSLENFEKKSKQEMNDLRDDRDSYQNDMKQEMEDLKQQIRDMRAGRSEGNSSGNMRDSDNNRNSDTETQSADRQDSNDRNVRRSSNDAKDQNDSSQSNKGDEDRNNTRASSMMTNNNYLTERQLDYKNNNRAKDGFFSLLNYDGSSAVGGINIGGAATLNLGFRNHFRYKDTNFFLMPEAFFGFGASSSYGLFANGIYDFNIKNAESFSPYAGVGLGLMKIGSEKLNNTKLAFNIVLGANLFQVAGGRFYVDYSIRNFFKYKSVVGGLSLAVLSSRRDVKKNRIPI